MCTQAVTVCTQAATVCAQVIHEADWQQEKAERSVRAGRKLLLRQSALVFLHLALQFAAWAGLYSLQKNIAWIESSARASLVARRRLQGGAEGGVSSGDGWAAGGRRMEAGVCIEAESPFASSSALILTLIGGIPAVLISLSPYPRPRP